jgi:hypothetical protein
MKMNFGSPADPRPSADHLADKELISRINRESLSVNAQDCNELIFNNFLMRFGFKLLQHAVADFKRLGF